ncbi:hypothetical protein A3F39_02245 [Candidatus Berkelbacteria bacterium RIFCSPHIGHO2_12_FULL_50_11]|nr:MAG: hypothetical protein A3F39_02245 [Candidatus Berkelbacteria bacterium RIFCSPHIGHO2_12_FULL_50_11]
MPERPGPDLEVENQVVVVTEEPPKPEIEPTTNMEPTVGKDDQIGLEKNEEKSSPKPPTLSQEVAQIIERSKEIFATLTAIPEIHYNSEVVNQNNTEQKAALVNLDEALAIKEADSSQEAWQQTKAHLENLRPQLVALKEELDQIQTENAVDATEDISKLALRIREVVREYDSGLTKLEILENRYYAAMGQAEWNRDNAEMLKLGLPPLKPGEIFESRKRTVNDEFFARDKRPTSERAKDLIPFTRAWGQSRKAKDDYHKTSKVSSIKFKRGGISNLPDRGSYALAETDGRLAGDLVAGVYGRFLSLAQDRYQVLWQQAMFDNNNLNAVERAVMQGRLRQLLDWNEDVVSPTWEAMTKNFNTTLRWGDHKLIPHRVIHYKRDQREEEKINRTLDGGKAVLLSEDVYYTKMIEETIANGKVGREEIVELQRLAILGNLKENYTSLYGLSYDLERFDSLKTRFPDAEFQAQCIRLEQEKVAETFENSSSIYTNAETIDALKARYPEDTEFQERCTQIEKQALLSYIDTHFFTILATQADFDAVKARFPDPEFQAQLAKEERNAAISYIQKDFLKLLGDPTAFDSLKARYPDQEFQGHLERIVKRGVLSYLENSFNEFVTSSEKIDNLKANFPDPEFQSRCVELERRAVIEHLKTGGGLLLTVPSALDTLKARFPDEEFQAQCTSLEKEVIITELSNGSRQLFDNFDEFNGLKARYSDPKFQERCDELEKEGLVGFLLRDENALKDETLRQYYLARHLEPETQLLLKLPDRCPLLFDKKNGQVLRAIKEDFPVFINNEKDVDFIANILGQYGNAAQEIISGYGECLKKEIISRDDRGSVLEFLKHFRIIGPELMAGYLLARKDHTEKVYFAQLQSFLEGALGDKPMSQTQRDKPYYRELLHHVFQNNARNYGDFETTVTHCPDRLEDLEPFKKDEVYVINTLEAGSVKYKEGADRASIEAEADVFSEELKTLAAESPDQLAEGLNAQIDQLLASLPSELLPANQLETNENKLAVLIALQAGGEAELGATALEEIIWRYSLLTFGDHQNAITGIESRCAQSPNPTYSLLTEYHALAFDHRKEALRNVFQAVASNPDLESYFQQRFVSRQEKAQQTNRADVINRMQGKFGISPAFVQQIGERLYGKEQLGSYRTELGEEAVNARIAKLIERYERATGRFGAEKSISAKSRTKQVYGMLRSRRQATDRVLGEFIDTESAEAIPLTRVDNELLLSLAYEEAQDLGDFSPESYYSYLSQQSVRIGNARLSRTEASLDQFESSSGAQAKKLIGSFSKTKESALARMVGGVCVAQDNPKPELERVNIWEMPNYIQLVLHDPETMRCQGLVLLHHFTEPDGKKILTASFNPAQGYLQTTDEASIYRGLSQVVTEFAATNNFDMVGVSTNGTIRTNRTGGLFERAMDEQIDEQGREQYDFANPRQFSCSPTYNLDSINLIWKNNRETATPEKT